MELTAVTRGKITPRAAQGHGQDKRGQGQGNPQQARGFHGKEVALVDIDDRHARGLGAEKAVFVLADDLVDDATHGQVRIFRDLLVPVVRDGFHAQHDPALPAVFGHDAVSEQGLGHGQFADAGQLLRALGDVHGHEIDDFHAVCRAQGELEVGQGDHVVGVRHLGGQLPTHVADGSEHFGGEDVVGLDQDGAEVLVAEDVFETFFGQAQGVVLQKPVVLVDIAFQSAQAQDGQKHEEGKNGQVQASQADDGFSQTGKAGIDALDVEHSFLRSFQDALRGLGVDEKSDDFPSANDVSVR